jgi:mono/diheme cytochrome c family protein
MAEQHEHDGIKHREEKRVRGILRIFFAVLAACGVIFMGYYLFNGSENVAVEKVRNSQQPTAGKAVEATGAGRHAVAAGEKLFGSLCVGCHGKDARGGVCPDLTVSTFKYGRSRQDITKTITEGRPGGMPTFGGRIEKEQIESLVEFVLSLK